MIFYKKLEFDLDNILKDNFWCQGGDLNSRPPAYETSALTS